MTVLDKDRLAIDGGNPVRSAPYPPWPTFDKNQVAKASEVLASGRVNYWTGDEGRKFETEVAVWLGRDHALALANGTVALELAVQATGLGPGDEVIVTPRTFIASVACVVASGASPVFADVDRDSQTITAETIQPIVTERTRAIIPVHLAGWPADMPAIMALAEAHGLIVIEDAAQAHGATIDGRLAGSFGHAAAFSFCQDKIITTGGEGGAVVTDDGDLWEAIFGLRDHGKSYQAVNRRDHPPGFRWVHESFGTNARMTEFQSALGRLQLSRLDQSVASRRANAAVINSACRDVPGLRVTEPPPEVGHAYYKHYLFVEPGTLRPGWDRDRIMEAITAEGVPCFTGSCPEVYLEKAFDPGLRPTGRLPVAKELGETSLMFLVHPGAEGRAIEDTVAALGKVMAVAAAF